MAYVDFASLYKTLEDECRPSVSEKYDVAMHILNQLEDKYRSELMTENLDDNVVADYCRTNLFIFDNILTEEIVKEWCEKNGYRLEE